MLDDKIDAYLKEEMTSVERETFENEIKNDPGLEREVHKQILARTAIQLQANEAFKAELKQASLTFIKQKNKERRIFSYISSAAALLLLFLLVRYFTFSPIQSPEELFNHHFSTPEADEILLLSSRNPNAPTDSLYTQWLNGMKYYSAGEINQAITTIEPLISKEDFQEKPAAFLSLAILYLQNNAPEKAQQNLKSITSTYYRPYQQWYLALSFLKMNDSQSAKKHLMDIKNTENHPYLTQAKDILSHLD